MTISQYELLDLFVETMMSVKVQGIASTHVHAFGDDVDSFFEPPSAGLIAEPKDLFDIYGSDLRLIQKLADVWREEGADDAADVLLKIEQFINTNGLNLEKKSIQRIVDYVYTVV